MMILGEQSSKARCARGQVGTDVKMLVFGANGQERLLEASLVQQGFMKRWGQGPRGQKELHSGHEE